MQEEGLVLAVLRDKLNDEYPASVFIYSETVVCPFTNQPDNMFATAKYPLLLFAGKGEFSISKVVTDLFSPSHTKGNECVALSVVSDCERLF